MNRTVMSGILVSVPKVSIIDLGEKKLFVGYFVIGCFDKQHNPPDFFECISFGNTARLVQGEYKKNAEISISGRLKNFLFKDFNQTNHYTNVILAEQVCGADRAYEVVEKDIDADTREIYEEYSVYLADCYAKLSEKGYLCLSEDDYYELAAANYDISPDI